MSPEQKQLVDNLRVIAQKKDPAERAELIAKAASLEQYFKDQPRLQRETAEAEARLRRARRMLFWAKLGLLACAVGLVAAVAWLLSTP
jgi:ferric-dicitrate binding protein FerR (iron transport regulator)